MDLNRVYLDYNIYVALAKGKIKMPQNYSRNVKIYVSVAHADEFFNAAEKDVSDENKEHIEKLKNLFVRDLNNSGILNPSSTKVFNKPEKFDDALRRIREYDTRETIAKNAKDIHQNQKNFVYDLLAKDKSSMDNSNLSPEEIWKRHEVIGAVKKCREAINLRNSTSTLALTKDYGWYNARLIARQSKLEPFDLEQNIFKGVRPNFYKLEFLMEFLQDVLNICNYNRDKDERKVHSGIYDTEHSIYASYCRYFVTNDKRLNKRLNAIYYFLGLDTRCLSFENWYNEPEKVS